MHTLQSFSLGMPLISSQHSLFGWALQVSMQVRPCDLASTRHVWLSVRMSAAASVSMNQSSNFEESCPLSVGISWSMVVVRFDSLCVAHRVSVYAYIDMYWLFTGLGAGWSIMVRCHSLSVKCDSSSVGVDWGMLLFKLANCFLCCWNCSSKSAKVQCVSVLTIFIKWIVVFLWHRVVLSCEIQESWVFGTRDALCVLVSISSHHAVCLSTHSRGV